MRVFRMVKITPILLALSLIIVLVLIAQWLHHFAQAYAIETVVIALLLGMVFNSLFTISKSMSLVIRFLGNKCLTIAIIFLGVNLDIWQLFQTSSQAIVINLLCVSMLLFLTYKLGYLFNINKKLGLLIGVGTAICGGSAIAMTANVIDVEKQDVSTAIAMISLLGTVAIFLFPYVGYSIKMTQQQFGTWAGVAVQSVPQAVATGFAYGKMAGTTATVVKLIRVLLLAPMIILLTRLQKNETSKQEQQLSKSVKWYSYIPPAVIGFSIIVLINSLNLLPEFTLHNNHIVISDVLSAISKYAMIIAMTAIGLQTNIKKLITTSIKPLLFSLCLALLLAIISLIIIEITYT